MARAAKISDVGLEEVVLLEEYCIGRKVMTIPATHYKLLPAAAPQVGHKETIDCIQAAQKYGGVLIVGHRAKKPTPLSPPPPRQPY